MNTMDQSTGDQSTGFGKRLRELSYEIDRLEAEARKHEARGEREFIDAVEDLKQQRDAAAKKLDAFKRASDNAADDLTSAVEVAFGELETGVRRAGERLR